MTRRARHRLRIGVLLIFCLLFQQAALASYLCPMESMPAQATVMAEHCAVMGKQQAQDNPALCTKHCVPDRSTAADHAKLSVPALMLSPLTFAPVLMTPATDVAVHAEAPIARSDPPPRLRYCTLLI